MTGNHISIPDTVESTDDVTLRLYDLGGEGPPLLLCHATGFCGLVWQPVAAVLAEHFQCFTFDFRAHGRSTPPVGRPMVWPGMGEDVAAVVEAVSPDRPIAAVGHSMGATSIVMAEVTRPGTFTRVWGFEPILFDRTSDDERADPSEISEATRRRRAVFADRQEVLDRYGSRPPLNVLDRRALEAYVEHGFVDRPDGTVALRCSPEHEAEVFEHHNTGARSMVGELTVPFAVASGGDGMRPAEMVLEVAAEHPRIDLFRYDDLTHFGPLQAPDVVANDILTWLRA